MFPLRTTQVFCDNPHCSSRNKFHTSQRGFEAHLACNPECFAFFNSKAPPGTLGVFHEGRDGKRRRTEYAGAPPNPYLGPSLQRQALNPFDPSEFPQPDDNEVPAASAPMPYEHPQPGHDNVARVVDQHFNYDQDANRAVFQDDTILHDKQDKWLINLMKLLNDMHAPDYAFQQILRWAVSAQADGFDFNGNRGFSRKSNLKWMFEMTQNAHLTLPLVHAIQQENKQIAEIVCYDFVPVALSLLQDRSVMTQTNMALDMRNPLAMYYPPDGRLGEAMSGSVYRDMYKRYITNPAKQLLCPLISWFDRTVISGNDKFSLAPYMFTFAIFTEKFRRTIDAWKVLGYMPKSKMSSAERKGMDKGEGVRDYHVKLYQLLESYIKSADRLKNVVLPIGPHGSMLVDVICPILFIIQDMDEGDRLCARFHSHNRGVQRQCRACSINFEDLNDPEAFCQFVTQAEIFAVADSDDKELQKQWSTHCHTNAYARAAFGDPIQGIFGATPSEPMHCIRKGPVERVRDIVIKELPPAMKTELDRMAMHFHETHRQTCRKEYPSTNFGSGITNLTKISAKENMGILFLFVILSHHDEGWALLSTVLEKKGRNLADAIEVMEAFLCFDAWLRLPTHWHLTQQDSAVASVQNSIRILMKLCVDHLPRNKGNGWCLPKFHEMLHLVFDMIRFGSSTNFWADRVESLLKDTAKNVGRRSQQRHKGVQFEIQSAQRWAQTCHLDALHKRIGSPELYNNDPNANDDDSNDNESESDDDVIREGTGRATFGTIEEVTNKDGRVDYVLSFRTKTNIDSMQLSWELRKFIVDKCGPVKICTEYTREDLVFRCHPNHMDCGPIFDWMRVLNQDGIVYPCRLAAVVIDDYDSDNEDDNEDDDHEKYQLVVQWAKEKTGVKSTLFTEWEWSPAYDLVSPSSIVSECFVVSIKRDNTKILETLHHDHWAEAFTAVKAFTEPA